MQSTAQTISDQLLRQVSELIECRTGLYFPHERFANLERGLVQAAREVKCHNPRAYVESLLSRDLHVADLEILAGSLTTGETHFFRDPCAFEFIESTLLPGLIAAKRGGDQRLRIWSAGCATGEEPFSMAILLHRLIPNLAGWHITILGTDINPKALAKAAAGIYSEWSFRATPAWVKPQYFTAHSGGRYELQPWLKRMVSFAYLNLVDDVYPSVLNNTNAMDLIICRNVLLYFNPDRIAPVVKRLHRALAHGGQLVLGAVEASQMKFAEFTPVPAPGMALYQKNGAMAGFDRRTMIGSLSDTPLDAPAAVPVTPSTEKTPPLSSVPAAASPWTRAPTPDAVSAFPTSCHSAYAEANELYAAGRYVEARAILMAGTDPRSALRLPTSALGLLAQCHANLGELAEALVWCERALVTAKTDPTLHFLRVGILQELQRDDEALLALRNVLFLDPVHVLAHFTMANLYRRRDQRSLAAKHFANVRRLLANRDESEELPQSGGLTVGRLNAILAAMKGTRNGEGEATWNAEGGTSKGAKAERGSDKTVLTSYVPSSAFVCGRHHA